MPTITSFSPGHGRPGDHVIINGTGFGADAEVSFDNHESHGVVVKSQQELTAEVPSDATTGRIRVTDASGTATSAQDYTVDALTGIYIDRIAPDRGAIGTEVQIRGQGFPVSPDTVTVTFAGVEATAQVHSAQRIDTTVPAGVPTNRYVTVAVIGATGRREKSFYVE